MIRAIGVTNPLSGNIYEYGNTYFPSGLFECVPGFPRSEILKSIPVQAQITLCGTDSIVFQIDTQIDYLSRGIVKQMVFNDSQGPYSISNLEPGCYRLAIIANYPSDSARVNDTAYTTFAVESSPVSVSSKPSLFLVKNYPNPFSTATTLQYILPLPGLLSLRLLDITGRVIQTTEPVIEDEGQHSRTISLEAFPEGTYIAELTYTLVDGKALHIRKSLLHIR